MARKAAELMVGIVGLQQQIDKTFERLLSRFSTTHTDIHRFPHHLRGIGGADDRYVVPSVVAIGPYHHGRPHLQDMEEMKHAAVQKFCSDSGRMAVEVYEKVFSIADDARRCYDASLVAGFRTNKFATMMFLDGCFLLWLMDNNPNDPLLVGCTLSSGPSLLRDMFLLENQIPWLVLEALMEFLAVDVRRYVDGIGLMLFPRKVKKSCRIRMRWGCIPVPQTTTEDDEISRLQGAAAGGIEQDYKPPHLLGLLRFILIRSMPPQKRGGEVNTMHLSSMSIGAIDLVEMGVKLTASAAPWFADMRCQKKLVFVELSLSPLSMSDVNAGCLVNMAALESAQAYTAPSVDSDGYVVSSYLSVLAMLMDREQDVHELRRSGVLRSNFSDAQTLAFFKGLGHHLRRGYNYYTTFGEIEEYMNHRPVRNAVHKFVYNNYKVIAAVISIAGVLVSILQALYSLKKP